MRMYSFVLTSIICASSVASVQGGMTPEDWLEGDEVATKVLLWNPAHTNIPFSMRMEAPQSAPAPVPVFPPQGGAGRGA